MAKISKKWSTDVIIKFLEAYEEHPCLWNHKLPCYKDRNRRDAALKAMVQFMSGTVSEFDVNAARAKIRSIRNAYTLEHHKILDSYRSGTSDAIYMPTVGWFSVADRFLKGIVETRDTKNTLESQELQRSDDENQDTKEDDNSLNFQAKVEEEETVIDNRSINSPASSVLNPPTKNYQKRLAKRKGVNKKEEPYKKAKFNNTDNVITTAVNTLKEIAQKVDDSQATADEFETFGKTVAAHLRQLPINAALECQGDIFHYLIQKRLGLGAHFENIIPSKEHS